MSGTNQRGFLGNMDWYKIYNGLPADPRLGVIAQRTGLTRAETLALWITLHDYASRQKPRGSLYGLDAEETAVLLEIDTAKTEAALDAFYEKGMIDIENNIRDWAKLQYKSTDRVRAHRARKKQDDAVPEPPQAVTTPRRISAAHDPDHTNEIAAKDPKAETVHDRQESHSPTESVNLRVSAERHEVRCQRRIVDARLWDSMTPPQQDAALEIAKAYETMGRGLGYISSDWQRIPGSGRFAGNIADAHSRLINRYIDWTKACHKEKISHSMIIDILAFGFSCRALDRDRRQRSGTSRQNLLDGLTLYCRLQGWRPD